MTLEGTVLQDPLLTYAADEVSRNPRLAEIFALGRDKHGDAVALDAHRVCEDAAQGGSGLAMCICARFSRIGFGTPQSDANAFKWAERAASIGFAPGHYELAKCYEEGVGVPTNLDEARKHYESASDGGFGFAAYHLATMYHAGKFGNAAKAMALQHAERAYELGESLAAVTLATWYEHGIGLIKNHREAVAWYVRAADLGNFAASLRLSMAYAQGELGLQRNPEMARRYEALSSSQTP